MGLFDGTRVHGGCSFIQSTHGVCSEQKRFFIFFLHQGQTLTKVRLALVAISG